MKHLQLRPLIFLLLVGILAQQVRGQLLDPTFNPTDVGNNNGDGFNGIVHSTTLQPDGKILVAGEFSTYNGVACKNLGRLNTDGSLDASFNAGGGTTLPIRSVARQADGKFIIGGDFTYYDLTIINRVARINANGSIDASFTPGISPNYSVYAAVPLSDGKVLIGGDFTNFNGPNRIARFYPSGTHDNTFTTGTGANQDVRSTIVQPDGKIIIGGWFNSYNGTARSKIARVNTNGSVDSTFNPGTGANNWVRTSTIQPDGKVIIGGDFTSFNGTALNRIARLNADGSLDASFNPGTGAPAGTVMATAVQPDGKIIVGGYFTSFNGMARNRIVRLNADGSVDASFNPGVGADDAVLNITVQPDGKIIIGGEFLSYYGTGRRYLARLNADGSLDTPFNAGTGANERITAIVLQADGKALVSGYFTSYNGTGRRGIARFNTDGSLDPSFNTGPPMDYHAQSLILQADGKIIVGGEFTINNNMADSFTRLNADGSEDPSFNPAGNTNASVHSTVLQPDGKIIIGGTFTTCNGISSRRIARLNADGSLDASFNIGTGASFDVNAVLLQPDGKYIIGGDFMSYNGTPMMRIARINADGSLDPSFNPGTGANIQIDDMVLQPDGKILITGGFLNYNGTARRCIARVNADGSLDTSFDPGTGASWYINAITLRPDGKILIAGEFTSYNGTPRTRLALLNPDGSLDAFFHPGTGANSPISAMALQTDGKVIIGGFFTSYNGTGRNRITRVNGTAPDTDNDQVADHVDNCPTTANTSQEDVDIDGIGDACDACAPAVRPKLILEGPYDAATGLMSDALRSSLMPTTEPYTAAGYVHVAGGGGETTTSAVLSITGPNAIVDWVLVELRSATSPSTRIATHAALLQRDGDVVNVNGTSGVGFNIPCGNYYVAVRHRNHLGVMSLNSMALSTTPTSVDFSSAATATYGTNARKPITGTFPAQALWAGDASFNGQVRYTGTGNDRDLVLVTVGSTTPNSTITNTYSSRDVNMNGQVRYTGSGNDRDPILVNVGSTTPNNVRLQQLP